MHVHVLMSPDLSPMGLALLPLSASHLATTISQYRGSSSTVSLGLNTRNVLHVEHPECAERRENQSDEEAAPDARPPRPWRLPAVDIAGLGRP